MATQLLLLEDVHTLGNKGEIVSVKPGYAFNFLIPKKKALVADKNAIRRQARLQEERQKQAIEDRKAAEEIASRIHDQTFETTVKVDHDGHMYGSVSVLDIIRLIQENANVSLDKKAVQLTHAIKETGAHEVQIKLKEGVEATVHIKVSQEES